MPYIETKVICKNCGYDYGQTYYNQLPNLNNDDILENFNECHNESCGLEICDNCYKRCDRCSESFCSDCYKDNDLCVNCNENNDYNNGA